MLQERCTAADNISLVAHLLHRSRTHLQSMLLQSNAAIVEDFFEQLVSKIYFTPPGVICIKQKLI